MMESNADNQVPAPSITNERRRNSQVAKFTVSATAKPVMRFMPTYRMKPIRPFNKEVCEKIMKTVMDNTFGSYNYSPKSILELCAEVSEEIKNRIKSQNYDRYRYIVVVSIGEKLMQGCYSLVNFLWDADNDGYLSYTVDTPKFFAIATLYYIYYD
ncbi:tctex1 domain-containing protein 2 [Lucilia sericata]|uniref:tctex1 domain-containing protein 2 n=1 Tax=Lucilia sericata TaxID=13632 RepID=UPI0018A88092|nr:tctex1 domain-containing protein 2 [Lucilia sericata]